MIIFDTVRRYLEYKGYEVNYVSNFTDVDDKIIKKAIEEGRSECPEMPHRESIRMMELMDTIRKEWGLRYPME